MKNWALKGLACAAALQLTSCLVVTDDGDPIGTMTVEWSIDGLFEPTDCAAFAVDRLELVVLTPSGRFVDEFQPLCESFAITIELVEGRYSFDATLVDSFDNAATTTQAVDAIDVVAGFDRFVSIDFPIDSFL